MDINFMCELWSLRYFLFKGGSVFEGDSPVGLASWTRGSAWGTRQWCWRVAVHVAATCTSGGTHHVAATWTATRQHHWRVPQALPRVQLANPTGESPSKTDPPWKKFQNSPLLGISF
ncbi:hypothetical protein HKD37_04G009786 [Glycine soja]